MVALFLIVSGFAQENKPLRLSQTLEIHSRNAQQEQEIQNGIYFGTMKTYYAALIKTFNINDLDKYRFLNTRRTLDFTGSEVYVILYSAQELHDNFGKAINLNTILPQQTYTKIIFQADLEQHIVTPQIIE